MYKTPAKLTQEWMKLVMTTLIPTQHQINLMTICGLATKHTQPNSAFQYGMMKTQPTQILKHTKLDHTEFSTMRT